MERAEEPYCFEADTCDYAGMTMPLLEYRERGFKTGDSAIIYGRG